MYTTYHLKSAQEVNTDILDAIKTNLKKSMAYKIIISPRAQKEIENAIDFYAPHYSGAIYILKHVL